MCRDMRVRVGQGSYRKLKIPIERVVHPSNAGEIVGLCRYRTLKAGCAEIYPARPSKESNERGNSVPGHVQQGSDDIECGAGSSAWPDTRLLGVPLVGSERSTDTIDVAQEKSLMMRNGSYHGPGK